jgi:hypothetical protein
MSPGTITDINKLNKVKLQETIVDYLERVVKERKRLKGNFRPEDLVDNAEA